MSAGMDLARALFPTATQIVVAGSSAGGVATQALAPFLVRKLYGDVDLFVFNDAGPIIVNEADTEAIQARAEDWEVGKFFPDSCTDCDDEGRSTPFIKWRLDQDDSVKEAFYSTDNDATNKGYLGIAAGDICTYRDLIVTEHGSLHNSYPERYNSYIIQGEEHVCLPDDRFYTQEVSGVSPSDCLLP